ncbi:MAG: hypothetical protein ACR2MX_07795 [Cyclobacteriaceae bacterium]
MKPEEEIKSYGHFLLFLFIHAAYIDLDLHKKEIKYILDQMKALFKPDEDIYDIFLEIKDEYQELSTQAVEKVIKFNLAKFIGSKQSQQYKNMMKFLNEVIKADGVIQRSELKMMVTLKNWLEQEIAD